MSWQGTVTRLRDAADRIEAEAPISLAAIALCDRLVELVEGRAGAGETLEALAADARRILEAVDAGRFAEFDGHPEGRA